MNMIAQNIPAIGRNSSIDIGNWNVSWLGKTEPGYGPSNDSLQQALVGRVLNNAQLDVWILSEVVDSNILKSILAQNKRYVSLFSDYSAEQKNAILVDTSLFRIGPYKTLAKNNYSAFSTGRFPLEVALIPKLAPVQDTLFIIALHLKANTGNDSQKLQAYESRRKSCEWLSAYLKNKQSSKRILVAGDWNDDLDFSIYNELPSSLTECKKLAPNYQFLTQILTDKQISTTTGFDNPIDHQLASFALAGYCFKDSTFVWQLNSIIPNYSKNCSDHLPVISRFSNHLNNLYSISKANIYMYPLPANKLLYIEADVPFEIELLDCSGKRCLVYWDPENKSLQTNHLNNGIYTIILKFEFTWVYRKIVVRNDG